MARGVRVAVIWPNKAFTWAAVVRSYFAAVFTVENCVWLNTLYISSETAACVFRLLGESAELGDAAQTQPSNAVRTNALPFSLEACGRSQT